MLVPHEDLDTPDRFGTPPLVIAAVFGHTKVVEVLLRAGAYPDHRGYERRMALMFAAENGNMEMVELLLSAGAEYWLQDDWARSAMSWAAQNGRTEIVRRLFKERDSSAGRETTPVYMPDEDGGGYTPLTYAAEEGHEEVVSVLLENGANPAGASHRNRTPLLVASGYGHTGVVKLLLEKDNDLEVRDDGGFSPLSAAVMGGHAVIVKLLLKAGADPDPKGDRGVRHVHSPLQLALEDGFKQAIRLLFEHGVKPSEADMETALKWAASEGEETIVQLIIDDGAAHLLTTKELGNSLICHAARNGHITVVKLLLERGAKITGCLTVDNENDCFEKYKDWPLWEALQNGHEATARLLLEHAPITEWDWRNGIAILRTALENDHDELAEMVIRKNAELDDRHGVDRVCLELAIKKGNVAMVEQLLEACNSEETIFPDSDLSATLSEASLEVQGEVVKLMLKSGIGFEPHTERILGTALLWASWKGHETLAELILNKEGAFKEFLEYQDKGIIRGDNRTPLSLAAEAGNMVIVELLLRKGATVDSRDKKNGTPLSHAVDGGNFEILQLLLSNGAKLSGDPSALRRAVVLGHMEIVKVLLDNGADPRKLNMEALSRAATNGHQDIIGLLADWSKKMDRSEWDERRRQGSRWYDDEYWIQHL